MTDYNPPLVSIVILDFNRASECYALMLSLRKFAKFRHEVVYVSNGGEQGHVQGWYDIGEIDRWVRCKKNCGCGLGTRLAFQSCMTEWVMYVQVDQILSREVTDSHIEQMIAALNQNPVNFYMDLAGNQGHGVYSERAHLINRQRYLDIPGMSSCIGGPGPYADHKWTEKLVQEYMEEQDIRFMSLARGPDGVPLFIDNGKWSNRTYLDGAETRHSTDEKRLFIIKPFKQRWENFPNLRLNDEEWELALSGNWPVEGKIPEADKAHSFIYWKD
jgi:hypothetical protein